MKFKTLSACVGTNVCNALCPYCVSKMTAPKDLDGSSKMNLRNLNVAARIAYHAGVTTALITGKGEPTLYIDDLIDTIEILSDHFPLVELQTNGLLIGKMHENGVLGDLYNIGLTTICLSVAHYKDDVNQKVLLNDMSEYPPLAKTIAMIKSVGLSVRLSVVGCRGMIDTTQEMDNLVKFSKACTVDQLTWRPVKFPAGYSDHENRKRYEIAPRIVSHLQEFVSSKATSLLFLSYSSTVYDYEGQNLCISDCLTRSKNPEEIRQIIYFPNGEISYDWEYPGARIL